MIINFISLSQKNINNRFNLFITIAEIYIILILNTFLIIIFISNISNNIIFTIQNSNESYVTRQSNIKLQNYINLKFISISDSFYLSK